METRKWRLSPDKHEIMLLNEDGSVWASVAIANGTPTDTRLVFAEMYWNVGTATVAAGTLYCRRADGWLVWQCDAGLVAWTGLPVVLEETTEAGAVAPTRGRRAADVADAADPA